MTKDEFLLLLVVDTEVNLSAIGHVYQNPKKVDCKILNLCDGVR